MAAPDGPCCPESLNLERAMAKHIEVWHDETSDETAWIVSEEDETGSQTIAAFEHEDDDAEGDLEALHKAVLRGQKVAAKRGLMLVVK